MAKICIVCEKEIVEGYKIKESFVLDIIRKIKNKLKILKNNELFVCPNCLEEYKKRRKKFNNSLLINSIIAVLIFLVIIALPLIYNQEFKIESILVLIILVGFLSFFSLLSYIPSIEEQKQVFSSSQSAAVQQPSQPQQSGEAQQKETTALVVQENVQPPLQPLELSEKTKQIQQDISQAILSSAVLPSKTKTKRKKTKTKKQKVKLKKKRKIQIKKPKPSKKAKRKSSKR
ncbi:MAG: hypothetical protein N3D10_01945 [Candidatus Micrarchaeota archaeon]|nr:hypothetical protein [Candidatus Micrarchaeota archaeon]